MWEKYCANTSPHVGLLYNAVLKFIFDPQSGLLCCVLGKDTLTFSVLGNNLGMDWYLIQVKGKFCTQAYCPLSQSLCQFPCNRNWLGVLLLSPGWNAISSQGYPPAFHQASLTIYQYPFILLGWERHGESQLFFPRTQHIDLTRSCTQTSWSGAQCTECQASASPRGKR